MCNEGRERELDQVCLLLPITSAISNEFLDHLEDDVMKMDSFWLLCKLRRIINKSFNAVPSVYLFICIAVRSFLSIKIISLQSPAFIYDPHRLCDSPEIIGF